jgi:hypothetical protein
MPETAAVSRTKLPPAGRGEFSRPRGEKTAYYPVEQARTVGKRRMEGRMAIDLSLFNNSVTTLLDHLTQYHGEEAELETYVICARVKSPDIPGGSGLNWIVNPGGEKLAGGLLREVLKAVEGNGGNGNGHGPSS